MSDSRADSQRDTVLVTGSSRGIGEAIAMRLAQDGFNIVIHCRASVDKAETLKQRILNICAVKEKLRFIEGDGVEVIKQNQHRRDVIFFIDPPYTVAGKRLYRHSDIDHDALFGLMSESTGDFLMTYNNAEEIKDRAVTYRFVTREVVMKSTHHAAKTELLIGRNLEWTGTSYGD